MGRTAARASARNCRAPDVFWGLFKSTVCQLFAKCSPNVQVAAEEARQQLGKLFCVSEKIELDLEQNRVERSGWYRMRILTS